MKTNPAEIVVIYNPKASSGLGGYIVEALRAEGVYVHTLDPIPSRWRRLWPALRSLRWSRPAMWKARWENMVFSPGAWKRTSRNVARQLKARGLEGKPILQVGKEYDLGLDKTNQPYSVFIHHNLRLAVSDGVTPWLPKPKDLESFLELETRLYRSAQNVFVGASYVKTSLKKDYGVDEENIIWTGGGAPPYFEKHLPAALPHKFTGQIVFVGWDFGMKGGNDLLQGFARARSVLPHLTLLVVGPDPSAVVEQEGVVWLGPVRSPEKLAEIYRHSDLFVMPSLRDSFGFVFLEAMTQGVPCIGTSINAMPEIIQDGKTGYLVPPRDPQALADAMIRYYERENHRLEMGLAAMEHVNGRYTWRHVAQTILNGMRQR